MFEPEPSTPHTDLASPEVLSDTPAVAGTPLTDDDADDSGALSVSRVRVALRRVKDPEINMNIVDLGLVYDIVVDGSDVRVDMSLTSPGCPSGPEIMGEAQRQVETIEGLGTATINLVWSPPWTPERIEPRVRAYLGF